MHLHNDEGVEAETLLREVLIVLPDAPNVQNNLAAALALQDRMEEANRVVDEMIKQHPDYFFGHIAKANRAISPRDFRGALEIFTPLQRREVLHATQFVALAKLTRTASVHRL